MSTDLVAAPPSPVPAKRKRLTKDYDKQAVVAAITNLESAMGGRGELVAALLHVPATDDVAHVIGLIADPQNDARKLAEICASGGITVGDLLEAYKRGAVAAAQVAAVRSVATHLPAVVEDTMTRARPHTLPCPSCQGQPQTPPCSTCGGMGTTTIYPDLDRQKFAAQLGGLGPKAAPLVDLSDRRTLHVGDPSPAGFASLIGAVDQFLHRRPAREADGEPPMEADVVDADPAPDPEDPVA